MDALSDNRLMQKVKEGEIDQLNLLFERYHRVLFSFFYNMSRNMEQSEDLVQNVFVRILKYRHRFEGTGDFKAWMFHIAKNVHYDQFRKKRVRPTENVTDWQDQLADQNPIGSQQLIEKERMKLLQEALKKLEPDKREIIIMSKLEGLRYQEIAEILGTTEGNIKVKVFRAIKALKNICQDLSE